MEKILNYINGQLVEAIEQNQFEVVQPATGKPYTTAPLSKSADLEKAIHAADVAFEKWSGLALDERCQWLLKIAGGIEAHFDEFVQAESMDNGKPVSLAARVDIPRSISNFQFFAGAAQHFASESHYTPNSGINYTIRKPLGVVGCISPWNLPM